MSKIAILYDVDGWAYHAEARSMSKYMRRYSLDCNIFSYTNFYSKMSKNEREEYKGVFLFPRQAKPMTFPAEKTIVKFSSFGDFSQQETLNAINFKYIICTNRQILSSAISQIGKKNNNIIYMPLCIDSELFYPKNNNIKNDKKLTIGFAGNSRRAGKGFDIIEKAVEILGNKINFIKATYHGNDRLTYEKMPDFYRSMDLLICMSKEEGGPLTSFEAGMCGIPTISGCKKSAINEVTISNYNSFHIDRDVNSLVEKINEINENRDLLNKSKQNIYQTMYFGHSWDSQARSYARLLEKINT